MKPLIQIDPYHLNGERISSWRCSGLGVVGWGYSVRGAYMMWRYLILKEARS